MDSVFLNHGQLVRTTPELAPRSDIHTTPTGGWFRSLEVLINFVQTREMTNLPSQMIPDMLDMRQIWGTARPRKDSNSAETDL
ncbi:hypothetical protein TNCV_616461 [Trichonephila clavipes]|nr:hypothetical protein TNCV_616461 [Trichonephila clavipes]